MKTAKNEPLVSIIVPVYNAGLFLDSTIESVLAQTYENWELILVNDRSTDGSKFVAEDYLSDKRIHWIDMKQNSGAATSRNAGIELAKGRYIAFLDADDLWDKEKLAKQIAFMQKKDCAFSFTGYEFATPSGVPNGKKVNVPATITYKQALKNTTIFTSTVIFDTEKLPKESVKMPAVPSEDTATWWQVLKTVPMAYGINDALTYYRRNAGSLSANKIAAIHRIWNLYRNVEKLNVVKSCYYFTFWAFNATRRRV